MKNVNWLAYVVLGLITCSQSYAFADTPKSSTPTLPALNALPAQTSVSGLSSGAFMAAQFHVAYSKDLVGAGIVAGGPWNCAASNPMNLSPLSTAVTTCMDPCKGSIFGCLPYPNAGFLADLAQLKVKSDEIDDLNNLKDDHIYIFSGLDDHTVVSQVVETTVSFYQGVGVQSDHIMFDNKVKAGHAFITTDYVPGQECSVTKSPYINDCDLPQAQKILQYIYGDLNPSVSANALTGDLIKFDQSEFLPSQSISMDHDAYVYVPKHCQEAQCRVHVAIHGCEQGIAVIGDTYVKHTGYLEVADNNDVIVLFPQASPTPLLNPKGCWDFWGYTSNNLPPYNYYSKQAPQMVAIKKMIDRLTSQPTMTSKVKH